MPQKMQREKNATAADNRNRRHDCQRHWLPATAATAKALAWRNQTSA
jgi:hypothetical protein